MSNPLAALAVSYLFIFGVIVIATGAAKLFSLSGDASRKIIHIGVGHWIIFALYIFTSPVYLAIVPASFILINYISYKFNIIGAMEQQDQSLGTVWYAVSLLILALVGNLTGYREIAIGGILCMAYGDGFAAIAGKRWGKNYPLRHFPRKSLPGFAATGVLSFVVVLLTLLLVRGELHLLISLLVGVAAALLEAASGNGLDNLSVPLGTSFLMGVLLLVPFTGQALAVWLITLAILAFALWRNSLTWPAAVHAMLMALVLYYFGGMLLYSALIGFFILGSALSKIGKQKAEIEKKIHARSGPREVVQVYANGGVPLLLACLYQISGYPLFALGAVLSFAAAAADTASSEIGMLSKQPPISIVGFRKTQTGLSGGVTLLGMAAGLFFSFVISLLLLPYGIQMVLVSTLGGFLGTIVDSVLGATIQAKYIQPGTQLLTEKRQLHLEDLQLYSGFKKINNDLVNFLSVLVTSTAMMILVLLIPLTCAG